MQNRTRILLFSFYAPPDLSAGSFRMGALLEEAKRHASEIEIDCLTTMPNRYHDFNVVAAMHELDQNVTIIRMELPEHGNSMLGQIKAYFKYAISVEKFLRKNKKEYDVVVATSSRLMTAALGALWSRRLNKPLYLDIRDLFLDTLRGVLSSSWAKLLFPLIALLEKWTLKRASKINVVSQGFVEDIQRIAPNINIGVIPNGIDAKFLEPLPYRAPEGRLKIVYAGNVGEGQGLENVLPRAAKKLEAVAEFHIVGSGGRMAALKLEIEKCKTTNVFVHSPVSRNELRTLYSTSDVLYLQLNKYPAFEKVLPSKLFEYAATEKPILAAVSGYAAEFVNSQIANSIVIFPCDETALIDGVMKIAKQTAENTDRSAFTKKYDRRALSADLLKDILSVSK